MLYPIGIQNFESLRKGGFSYVDKTDLIYQLASTGRYYFLGRPRRFGKSLLLSTMEAYFQGKKELFQGLAIENLEKDWTQYPVLHLDLGGKTYDKPEDLEITLDQHLCQWEKDCGTEARYPEPDARFKDIIDTAYEKTGKPVVILIDEYDKALTNSFGMPHQDEIARFMTDFMNATIKENRSRQMAYITGVTQVAKAGFFSGANNLWVDNIFNTSSGERFGFTDAEVRDILSYYGHPERFDEVRDWYDGYRFGDVEVYNPFSVMMCIQRGFKPDSYWRDSSRNTPVRWMLDRTGSIGWQAMADLINGGTIRSELHQTMSYDELRLSDPDDLLSLMVMTGYLNAVPVGDGVYELSIPNREVMGIVDSLLSGGRRIGSDLFDSFNRAVLEGDAKAMETTLQSVLADGSYFSLRDESSYENIVLTMMHGILRGYRISSQQESGNGRLDLVLEPRDEGTVPIIIELKVSDSESDLERDAEGAVAQIHDRKYYLGMRGDVILIAGKGHETYQIVGDVKHHFDDREEVRRAFGLLGAS